MIEIKNLHVYYPQVHAVSDLSLRVGRGTVCGVVGMNGSGKSSTFKAIMGLVNYEGKISIDGKPVEAAKKRCLVGYVPQNEDIDYDFPISVFDVVMMGRYGHMNFLRHPKPEDCEAVEFALEKTGLLSLKTRPIGALSGGQRKRAFIARSLAQQAQLLILDEPFAGVDVNSQELIIRLLRQLAAEGKTILISTHDLDSLEVVCDEVALIRQSLIFHGPTSEALKSENMSVAFAAA